MGGTVGRPACGRRVEDNGEARGKMRMAGRVGSPGWGGEVLRASVSALSPRPGPMAAAAAAGGKEQKRREIGGGSIIVIIYISVVCD